MTDHELENLPSSGLVRRLLAALYDWLLVIAVMMLLSVPFVALTGAPIAAGNNGYRAFLLVIVAAFFCGFWRYGGQTVGMRAWRLRLIGEAGTAVSWRQALARLGLAAAGLLPAGAGFWCMLFDPYGRSWHDRLSRTRVVQLPPRRRPPAQATRRSAM